MLWNNFTLFNRPDNYLVPKGTTVGIFTYVLHRDPIAYPQPERFLPERFLPENVNGRHPYSFIPFSAGPRVTIFTFWFNFLPISNDQNQNCHLFQNCIGQKFAMMEMKMVIAKILRHYHLQSVQPRDQLVIVGEMILRSLNGLKMVFSRRTQVQRWVSEYLKVIIVCTLLFVNYTMP